MCFADSEKLFPGALSVLVATGGYTKLIGRLRDSRSATVGAMTSGEASSPKNTATVLSDMHEILSRDGSRLASKWYEGVKDVEIRVYIGMVHKDDEEVRLKELIDGDKHGGGSDWR
jgi:hypothetical protein